MAKKNLSAEKGSKVVSSASTLLLSTNSDHGKQRKISSKANLTEDEKREYIGKKGRLNDCFCNTDYIVFFSQIMSWQIILVLS